MDANDTTGNDSLIDDTTVRDALLDDASGGDDLIDDTTGEDVQPDDTSGGDDLLGDASGNDSELGDTDNTDVGGVDTDLGDDASAPVETDTVDDTTSPVDTSSPPPTWDLAMIRDPTTAMCAFTGKRTVIKNLVVLDVWNVSYRSWEVIDGTLVPITIRGFAARPQGAGFTPGIVQAHGLGGYAEEDHATGLAALTRSFVIAYTGPGGGTTPENSSDGRPTSYDNGRRLFDTVPDVRGSWFWGHAVAAMRAVTCLSAHPEVDPTRLGMTGFSAGAVATLTVAGVDDRVRAAVPLSGTLAWGVATQSPRAWQHELLAEAGLDSASPAWQALLVLLDPTTLLAGSSARIFMVNGTSDEFFPISATLATFDPIGQSPKRLSLVGNLDHGCFLLTGGEPAGVIEARAELRANGARRMWFAHHFGTDARFANLPRTPELSLSTVGAATYALATVDEGTGLGVAEVKLWWSNDDAFLWGSNTLQRQSAGVWGALVPVTRTSNFIAFVDVEYKTSDLIEPARFSLSSRPDLPAGHVPRIRGIDNCQGP